MSKHKLFIVDVVGGYGDKRIDKRITILLHPARPTAKVFLLTP
jgi:hypothetical protein